MPRQRGTNEPHWLIPGDEPHEDRRFSTLGAARDMADHLALMTGDVVSVWTEYTDGALRRLGEIVYTARADRAAPLMAYRTAFSPI